MPGGAERALSLMNRIQYLAPIIALLGGFGGGILWLYRPVFGLSRGAYGGSGLGLFASIAAWWANLGSAARDL
jgi:hypothetical protein